MSKGGGEFTADFILEHARRNGLPPPKELVNGREDLRIAALRVMEGVKARTQPRPRNRALEAARRKAREALDAEPDAQNPTLEISLQLPPSVNHLYATVGEGNTPTPRRRMVREGKDWKREAQDVIMALAGVRGWKCTRHSKIVVEITVYWPDNSRGRDMHNLHKLLLDTLQGIIYANDSMALPRDMDFGIDAAQPRMELRVYQKGTEGATEAREHGTP